MNNLKIYTVFIFLFTIKMVAQKPLNKCYYFKANEKSLFFGPSSSSIMKIYSKKDKRVKSISDGTVEKIGEISGGIKIITIKKDEKLYIYSGINKISKKIRIGENVMVGEFLGSLKKEEGHFKLDFEVFNGTTFIGYKENIECDVREK